MCDEYDDERMWLLWRRLERPAEVKDLRESPSETGNAPIAVLPAPATTAKPRTMALSR